jgi:HD superfamily phosphohydrolase
MNNLPTKRKPAKEDKFQEVLGFEKNFIEFHIDPLHGAIGITEEEKNIIDGDCFQRLKYIRQLGLVHRFYGSATHTRYEHSLGVLHTTWEVFKRVFSNFGTKNHTYAFDSAVLKRLANPKIIRALRIAGLCHDLGHGPFSHTFEIISGELLPNAKSHDEITYEMICNNEIKIDKKIQELVLAILDPHKMSLSGKKFEEFQFFLHDIIAGDIGSDRIDYLLRDTYMTGLGHRFGLNHLLDAITAIYAEFHETPSEMKKRLYFSVEASEKDAVFYFLTTRFYHFQLIAKHRENIQLETEFKKGFEKYLWEQLEGEDTSTIIDEFQKSTDDEVRQRLKDYITKLEFLAKWTLFDVEIPLARFFAYRFSYKTDIRSTYAEAIRDYLDSADDIVFSFNIQKARIPVIPVTMPSYIRVRPSRNDDGTTTVEYLNSLLHEFSPLLFGLARTYLRSTTITVFCTKKNDDLKTELENSPKFLFHDSVIEQTLEACADKIKQTEEEVTYCDRLDFLILFVAAMRKMPKKMAMYKDRKRIILFRFRSLQFLIREVQSMVFSDESNFPYRYGEESRFYNPSRDTEEFLFHKTLFNDLFLLELFEILDIDIFSDHSPSDENPNQIEYYKTYMLTFKLSHLNKIIEKYSGFTQYRILLRKIEKALIQIGIRNPNT